MSATSSLKHCLKNVMLGVFLDKQFNNERGNLTWI